MPRRTSAQLPPVARILRGLGENLRLARLRRRIPATSLAERAGMSRPTLRSLERGEASVTLGALANVLNSLGLVKDLAAVAAHDELGRRLQDAALTNPRSRRRASPPKTAKAGEDDKHARGVTRSAAKAAGSPPISRR